MKLPLRMKPQLDVCRRLRHPVLPAADRIGFATGVCLFVVSVSLLAAEVVAVTQSLPTWNQILKQPSEWYGGDDARKAAASVTAYQTEVGGWPKNVDMTQPPETRPAVAESTIDNGATTTQIRFLARVVTAQVAPDAMVVAAVERGIDYLLSAQYENGGWPQFFPLRKGYYTHVTFNDNAMVNVLRLLHDVGRGEEPFAWIGANQRERARVAVQRGIACILRAQVVVDGRLTAWCAQHDEVTLAPAPARKFEPISLSGYESVELVEFLIDAAEPTPEVIRSVEAAVAWLDAVKLTGWRIERPMLEGIGKDRVLVRDPSAPPVWARFYEIGTNRPIFAGRSAVVHYDFAQVEPERRAGYAYYGNWGADLLESEYPRWKAALATR